MIATGMSRTDGRRLDGLAHLRQSIQDILTTSVGSSVMNREYGSLLPELIDHPGHGGNLLRLMSATVMALGRWEPRLSIRKVSITLGSTPGALTIDLEGTRREGAARGQALSLNIPIGGLR
ncbi:Baseplate assembly protein [Ferriphaselus amnicola]|uniref:Baseplate assembly protein n=1 Tax=Ferriphaselus amnicola TaxID=1188319 RepID=A0A2Z6GBZ8_9PROT|nr:GPW/gp25 family protein [Ferriphaselus amnicola]BBE51141.1 Baseplate assembly protein [Ferriphaselus amnicola]